MILVLIGMVIGVGIGTAKSHQPTAAQVAKADRNFERSMDACLNGKFIKESRLPAGQTLETWCSDTVNRSDYHIVTSGTVLDVSGLAEMLKAMSFLLIVIGVVIGASSVGADWQSGSMATLLTWDPRRIRVLLVRVAVVAVVVLVLALALQTVLSLMLAAGAALRGVTITPPGFWADVAQVILRIGGGGGRSRRSSASRSHRSAGARRRRSG